MNISERNIINGKSLNSKEELFLNVAQALKAFNADIDVDQVVNGLQKRESESSTGFEDGIAIPHTVVNNLDQPEVMIINGLNIDWPSMDGKPTNVAIAILVPATNSNVHLQILASLSKKLIDEQFRAILKGDDDQLIIKTINDIKQPEAQAATQNTGAIKVVAVTGCPTGIAHTFMAAENLARVGAELNYQIKVETRGQGGVGNEITTAEIQEADYVIICSDVDVAINRFNQKKVLIKPVKSGISNSERLFEEMKSAPLYQATEAAAKSNEKFSAYKSLMNGVTHMLPFTIAGGILIAMRFFFGTTGDIEAGLIPVFENVQIGQFFGDIGGLLFGLMLPILAGYIAYSIGNRAALMPGILAGLMASNDGSGFLGAILGGFIAGFFAKFLFEQLNKLPKSIQGSYQILFMPLISAIGIGLFMYIFAIPIGYLNESLTTNLQALQDFNPLLLGALVGAMMAVDMGGPINKAAYVTGTLLLAEGNQQFMAAVMAGGMVPPLAIALSAVINKSIWTSEERDAAKTNWLLGLSFITEGAIPFAAGNPKQVIPALMIGSAVAGSLTMMFNITLPAPHGGIFVFPLVNSPAMYAVAIIIGAIVGALALKILKRGK